jgi:transcriptional regulator with XRE-family HTH domain
MFDLPEIGEMVRKARKEKRMSQSDLAAAAGCSRSTVEELENGKTPEIGLMLTLRLMHAVDLDLVPGSYNAGRPTLEQLHREEEEATDAPRLGR